MTSNPESEWSRKECSILGGTVLERQRNKQRAENRTIYSAFVGEHGSHPAEGWTLTKADEKRIESAELWTVNQLD